MHRATCRVALAMRFMPRCADAMALPIRTTATRNVSELTIIPKAGARSEHPFTLLAVRTGLGRQHGLRKGCARRLLGTTPHGPFQRQRS